MEPALPDLLISIGSLFRNKEPLYYALLKHCSIFLSVALTFEKMTEHLCYCIQQENKFN